LTRTTLASKLVSAADLAIDTAKELTWMDMYERDRDTLEDVLYRRLQDLWAPFTDALQVFTADGSDQPLCAQKPVKVLKQAGLRHDTPVDWQTGDAVHALYLASQKFMTQTLHTDSEGASDNDDSEERPSLLDSDSDT